MLSIEQYYEFGVAVQNVAKHNGGNHYINYRDCFISKNIDK